MQLGWRRGHADDGDLHMGVGLELLRILLVNVDGFETLSALGCSFEVVVAVLLHGGCDELVPCGTSVLPVLDVLPAH